MRSILQRISVLCCLILIFVQPSIGRERTTVESEARAWTATDTQKTIVAGVTGITVEMQLAGTDERVRVAVERLSPDDLRFLASLLNSTASDMESSQALASAPNEKVGSALSTGASPKAIELIRLLSDARPELRSQALQKLGDLQESSTKIVDATVESLQRDPSPVVRNEAAATLGRLPDLGDQKRRICKLLLDAAIGTQEDVPRRIAEPDDLFGGGGVGRSEQDDAYRRIALSSLVKIDRNGPSTRKVIDIAIAPRGNYRDEKSISWALGQLSELHRADVDVSWILKDLTDLSEEFADQVVQRRREYPDGHTHSQLIEFLKTTMSLNPRFEKHLQRYSTRDLPAVSRSNRSAENLLIEYQLILQQSR